MLSFLPSPIRGLIAATLLLVNTLAWCALLFAFAIVKLVLPLRPVRAVVDRILNALATAWIACNSGWMRLTQRAQWDVSGLQGLRERNWYMVNCNHQSWADILVLQHLLNRRIPMLKFFLKQQLLYVPVIGLAWWALDFPFMRRHSDAYLRAHPEKRLEDLKAARTACRKFSVVPTSVMNFAEGTRFTPQKHKAQNSPYRHLLKPKTGALALALNVLGNKFHQFLDVTIVYPGGAPTFWQFLCGDVPRVVVRLNSMAIPPDFCGGDYQGDPKFRRAIQRWVREMWREKDRRIDAILARG
jgi:1-acyl-sn-glycerol-3-phosphate acyltransferase